MSAFGGKADIGLTLCNVCFWPKADIDGLAPHNGPLNYEAFWSESAAMTTWTKVAPATARRHR